MADTNDNRMGWIRNIETLASTIRQYTVEYKLALSAGFQAS